ncbi:MAG TPA: homoserine kinase [Candidatus Udaeobacter sp.]|nr:homoserine kinase [Candidatus Udaeobacter sp.]
MDRLPLKAAIATLRLRMQQVTVRVPASTSNLGPGFDCLGIALGIYNRITVTSGRLPKQPHAEIISRAARRFFKMSRRRAFPFCVSTVDGIPRSRGLGGSATIRLGILNALNRLSGDPLDLLTMFQLCAELEGHPDNAAPSTFGGFTVVAASKQRGVITLQRFEVSPRLRFVLLIPELEISTSLARKILPSRIPHAAAVENCGNACAITAAFASKHYEKLRGAFVDFIHQPFRKTLIPFLGSVIAAAEKAGALGAFLSGSGSTICAITLRDPGRVAAAMKRVVRSPSHIIVTGADNRGVHVMRSVITDQN